jgi:hypothetical protein
MVVALTSHMLSDMDPVRYRYVNLPTHRSGVLPFIVVNTVVFVLCKRLRLPVTRKDLRPLSPLGFRHFYLSSFVHRSFGHFLFVQIGIWTVGSHWSVFYLHDGYGTLDMPLY